MGKKDYGLSMARLIATLFIIICHIMQVRNNDLGLWFNVGVQMFLYMSGLLYGTKTISDPAYFMLKRLMRLLIPFYVFALPFCILMCVTGAYGIGWVDVLHFLTLSNLDFADGIGHLWFIPCIIVCYFLLYIFLSILQHMDDISDDLHYLFASLLLLAGVEAVFQLFIRNDMMKAPWINCFVLGLISSRLGIRDMNLKKAFLRIALALCIVLNAVQIFLEYGIMAEYSGYLLFFSVRIGYYAHVFLGIILVELIRMLYGFFSERIKKNNMTAFLDVTDRLSYSVYLVHFVLIKGVFSLYGFIDDPGFATLLIFVSAIALGVIIDLISGRILKRIVV